MLQQIIQDMFIDPELLAELSDEQKQILFVKMREEQVRRWKEGEDEVDAKMRNKPKKPPKPGAKRVNFMKGADGKEWVWVMGDAKGDKPIEVIVEEEAQARALRQAEREAEDLKRKEEENARKQLEEDKRKLEKERAEKEAELRRKKEEAALYQSLKEARIAAQKLEEEQKKEEEEVTNKLQEITMRHQLTKQKSIEKVDNQKKRRSNEIYIKWKEMRKQMEKVAEESSKEVDKEWREQEKKSKEAEHHLREIARQARAEHRMSMERTSTVIKAVSAFSGPMVKPPLPPKKHLEGVNRPSSGSRRKRPPRPPNREAVIKWFMEEEKTKFSGFDPDTNKVAEWFHGVLSRMDSEKLLIDMPLGSYLVRVSERVWGYTISYRAEDRCKHFLVDASDGYQFFGTDQVAHKTLAELVNFHKDNPITMAGGEKLLQPCGQKFDPPDYSELFSKSSSV